MQAPADLLLRLEIDGCNAEQAAALDQRRFGDWPDFYTADGRYTTPGGGQTFSGNSGRTTLGTSAFARPPATVGQIIIVGNQVTRQNVILRQVPLYPGQTLTYPDLRIAEAVEFIHQAGRLHLDLKPGNILLTPEGIPKVSDFGIAVARLPWVPRADG